MGLRRVLWASRTKYHEDIERPKYVVTAMRIRFTDIA